MSACTYACTVATVSKLTYACRAHLLPLRSCVHCCGIGSNVPAGLLLSGSVLPSSRLFQCFFHTKYDSATKNTFCRYPSVTGSVDQIVPLTGYTGTWKLTRRRTDSPLGEPSPSKNDAHAPHATTTLSAVTMPPVLVCTEYRGGQDDPTPEGSV